MSVAATGLIRGVVVLGLVKTNWVRPVDGAVGGAAARGVRPGGRSWPSGFTVGHALNRVGTGHIRPCRACEAVMRTPPHVVQQIVGHSAIDMTMTTYAHASQEAKRKALQNLGKRLA
jgi:integrase